MIPVEFLSNVDGRLVLVTGGGTYLGAKFGGVIGRLHGMAVLQDQGVVFTDDFMHAVIRQKNELLQNLPPEEERILADLRGIERRFTYVGGILGGVGNAVIASIVIFQR